MQKPMLLCQRRAVPQPLGQYLTVADLCLNELSGFKREVNPYSLTRLLVGRPSSFVFHVISFGESNSSTHFENTKKRYSAYLCVYVVFRSCSVPTMMAGKHPVKLFNGVIGFFWISL